MALGTWLLLLAAVAWAAHKAGRTAVRWAALAGWTALPVYNAWILSTCPGDCSIRVDLLLVAPVLIGLTVSAIWTAFRDWRRKRRR